MKILIKYATRGRAELFKRSIKNIHDTISKEANFRILVSADSDDLTMCNTEITKFLADYPKVEIIFGRSISKIDAINRDSERFGDFDLLINFSDDMYFVMKDWDKIMIPGIQIIFGNNNTDFFAHFNDNHVGEKLPTMSIMGREYYERFFYIYAPCYKSVSCDAEAMFVAQMLEKHSYFPWVLFEHKHPANLPSTVPNDDTYARNDKFGAADTETYFQRRAKLFYVNNPKVIPFRPHIRE